MKNMDYKIFVPRGVSNYVRFDGTEIEVFDFLTVNIHFSDDKVTYWLYVKIDIDDQHNNLILKKGKKPDMALLIGNSPYEIHGEAEIIANELLAWEAKRRITISFTAINASQTTKNPREQLENDRFEMLDLRKEEDDR